MNNIIDLDKNFFFGGNATFTIESEKTGQWRTYKIRKMRENINYPSPAYAVSLLAGPDNENSYAYIGTVNPFNGEFKITRASKRTETSSDVVIFKWLMKHLFTDKILQNGKVHHDGKCGCCGRKLTVPESIKNGIGPECMKRFGY